MAFKSFGKENSFSQLYFTNVVQFRWRVVDTKLMYLYSPKCTETSWDKTV